MEECLSVCLSIYLSHYLIISLSHYLIMQLKENPRISVPFYVIPSCLKQPYWGHAEDAKAQQLKYQWQRCTGHTKSSIAGRQHRAHLPRWHVSWLEVATLFNFEESLPPFKLQYAWCNICYATAVDMFLSRRFNHWIGAKMFKVWRKI